MEVKSGCDEFEKFKISPVEKGYNIGPTISCSILGNAAADSHVVTFLRSADHSPLLYRRIRRDDRPR